MYESKKKSKKKKKECNMHNGYEKEKKNNFKVDLMMDWDR